MEIFILMRSGMCAPAGRPAASKTGRGLYWMYLFYYVPHMVHNEILYCTEMVQNSVELIN